MSGLFRGYFKYLYGANFTTNGGNTTYSWSPTTGEMLINGVSQGAPGGNRILLTVWDGGGNDTYDFSSYSTNLRVDLQPGAWTTTSTTQLARLHYNGSRLAVGNIANALLHKGDTRSLIENAFGGAGSDIIVGNQAANLLKGNAGNDSLTGGAGNDTLDGGAGTDTAVYSGQRAHYTLVWKADGSIQVSDVRSGAPDGSDLTWNIELFQFADRVYTISELRTGSSSDTFNTTNLTGSESVTDPVVYEPAPVNLMVSGTDSNDTLYGATGSDKLYGTGGNDVLIGGAGNDYLNGGSGIDYASYANASAGVVASLTSASVNQGDAAGDTYSSIEGLIGSSYADKLIGNNEANTIKGGAGDDRLYGLDGNDALYGGDGNDLLYGGLGKDVLYGGADADIFVFTAISHSRGSTIDTIKDFMRGIDRIDLRSIDANAGASGDQAFNFIGASSLSGKAGQVRFASSILSGDVNGDKVADFQVKVVGLTTLSKGDFYL